MRTRHLSPRRHAGAAPEASGPYPRPVAGAGVLVHVLAGRAAWESAALSVARVISLFIPMPSILLTPATIPATSAGWALVTGPLTIWLVLRRWEPVR